MALKTNNPSTVRNTVNIKARIERELEEIVTLIQLSDPQNQSKIHKKLTFIYKLLERFREDEKENLFSSDKLALDYLEGEVVEFIKKMEEKTTLELLAMAKSLQHATKNTLG